MRLPVPSLLMFAAWLEQTGRRRDAWWSLRLPPVGSAIPDASDTDKTSTDLESSHTIPCRSDPLLPCSRLPFWARLSIPRASSGLSAHSLLPYAVCKRPSRFRKATRSMPLARMCRFSRRCTLQSSQTHFQIANTAGQRSFITFEFGHSPSGTGWFNATCSPAPVL